MPYPIETLNTRTSNSKQDRQIETDQDYLFWLENKTGQIAYNRDMGLFQDLDGIPKKNFPVDEITALAVEVATGNYNSGARPSRQVLTNSQLMEFENPPNREEKDSGRNSTVGYYRQVDLQDL